MNRKPFFMGLLFLVCVVGLFDASPAQDIEPPRKPSGNIAVAVEVSRPPDEAEIKGEIPDYEFKRIELEYLQTLPPPQIQFVFGTPDNRKLDLTAEARKILDAHWKEAIGFFFNDKFKKPSGAQAAYERNMAWARYCARTQRELQKLFIEAPKGKRKISPTEASDIYAFINRAAAGVIEEIKKIRNYAIFLRSNDRTQFFQRAPAARL